MELPKRQIEHLQHLANQMKVGSPDFDRQIEEFAKLAEELKEFIRKNNSNPKVINKLNEMPFIEYKEAQSTFLSSFVRVFQLRKSWQQKEALDQAKEIATKMGTIEWLWYT